LQPGNEPALSAGIQSATLSDTAVLPRALGGIAVSGRAVATQGAAFKVTASDVDEFGDVDAGHRVAALLGITDSTGGT
jgi:hypothetical protein